MSKVDNFKDLKKNKKKILITGGAGYIGSAIANDLLRAGHEVTIIDNLSCGQKKLIPKRAIFFECDISNTSMLKKIFNKKKFDIVMHFAAFIKVDESVKKPKKYIYNNFKKTKIFINFCLKYKLNKIIFSSTASVYGNKFRKIKENDKLSPANPYAYSKMKCEKFIINRSKKIDLKYIILRYFNVAGSPSNLETGLIAKKSTHLIKRLCQLAIGKIKNFYIYGNDYPTKDGTPIRDFIHITDLSKLHLLSMNYLFEKDKSQIFNCGYGKEYSVLQIFKATQKIVRRKLNFKFSKRRYGDIGYAVADNIKIKKYLKFKPKFNKIERILDTALKWEKKL